MKWSGTLVIDIQSSPDETKPMMTGWQQEREWGTHFVLFICSTLPLWRPLSGGGVIRTTCLPTFFVTGEWNRPIKVKRIEDVSLSFDLWPLTHASRWSSNVEERFLRYQIGSSSLYLSLCSTLSVDHIGRLQIAAKSDSSQILSRIWLSGLTVQFISRFQIGI